MIASFGWVLAADSSSSPLLGEDRVVGKGIAEAIDDDRLGRAIGAGDQIAGPLEVDVQLVGRCPVEPEELCSRPFREHHPSRPLGREVGSTHDEAPPAAVGLSARARCTLTA